MRRRRELAIAALAIAAAVAMLLTGAMHAQDGGEMTTGRPVSSLGTTVPAPVAAMGVTW